MKKREKNTIPDEFKKAYNKMKYYFLSGLEYLIREMQKINDTL